MIRGMIWLAEQMSYQICECCGTTKDVSQNDKGWITTLCKECRKKRHEELKMKLHGIDLNEGKDDKKTE